MLVYYFLFVCMYVTMYACMHLCMCIWVGVGAFVCMYIHTHLYIDLLYVLYIWGNLLCYGGGGGVLYIVFVFLCSAFR